MTDETFPILPARRRAMIFNAVAYLVSAGLGLWLAVIGTHWLWWVWTGVATGLFAVAAMTLLRRRYVARVDASGVHVQLATGREIAVKWAEIEGHTIDPARRIGAILVRAGSAGRVRMVPVSTRLMGPEAAERMLAAMKERLPKLEYRVPSVGRRG